jgi:hypothetical protein
MYDTENRHVDQMHAPNFRVVGCLIVQSKLLGELIGVLYVFYFSTYLWRNQKMWNVPS